MQINEQFVIDGDETSTVYVVRGIDPVSQRVWLCVTELEYDGYNGDVIVSPKADGTNDVVLADDRWNLGHNIKLTPQG